ncbi:MAG: aldo/keto reductase, partial [Alphaproteobacteria bacterium]|nr:aldo/keto reductase [Alphaproteobacteria bacterium]
MAANPRFCDGALEKNLTLVDQLAELASAKGVSLAQIALAWVLSKGDDIIPIPGTKKISRLEDNIGAVSVELSADDIAAIEKAVPPEAVAGTRYAATAASTLNA